MCSIVGFYRLDLESSIKDNYIENSFDLMRNRGPNNESYVNLDSSCTLGHQRLAIIDVDEEANQPMNCDNFTIVYNGEVYNYIELRQELIDEGVDFETSSDTEVLLKGYIKHGASFLKKINGMFSFSIYDEVEKKLVLVRDRFGVKPLHYMIEKNIFYFSSEIKPLIKAKDNIEKNINIYNSFFHETATDFNEETFIKDIYQVEKGSVIEIFNGEVTKKKWYYGNDYCFDESVFKSKEKTLEIIEDLLTSAIDLRMRADVPICLTLSGGIDSTTLYTLIKENLNKDIKLFTYIHPGSATNEYSKVKKLVDSYGDSVITVKSEDDSNFNDIKNDLDVVEFPIWGISTRAYIDMYNSIKKSGFKVVIEGHGSDEHLGGYPYMIESAFYDYLKQGNFFKALKMLKIKQATGHSNLGNKNKFMFKIFIKAVAKFILKNKDIKCFQDNIDWTVEYKILPIVLRAFDRLSMNSSLESRSPFMDYRVVELFKKLPIEYKVNSIGNKAVLREILKKYNKSYIYNDKEKMGFASDVPKFFNVEENKEKAKQYIEEFDMAEFDYQKNQALKSISQEKIEWSDTFDMSKVILISMINQKYVLGND
jgi:asparagine synthase (glutamine-hydrolysing)